MRKDFVIAMAAGALVLAGAQAAVAGVNCGLVKKDLEMGRTVEDISERMMAPIEEVKKCQEEGGGAGSNVAPAGDPAAEPSGDEAADPHAGHGH
jgi:hypothetical protein